MAESTESEISTMADSKTEIDKELNLSKVRANITSEKVLDLIDERAKDDDTCLPIYPSAQLWFKLTEHEQNDLIKAVETSGMKWSEFEKTMKDHWPIFHEPRKPITYRSRRA